MLRLGRRLIRGFQRSKFDRELAEELESHRSLLEIEFQEARNGAKPHAARLMGNVTLAIEDSREIWSFQRVENVFRDLRYGMRTLRKSPAFALVIIATLALGIGANTAIFSVVYALLLNGLPYANSEQLFNVFQQQATDETIKTGWSYPNFEDLHNRNQIFSALAGAQRHQLTLTGRGEPLVVNTAVVTGGFFSLFNVKPVAGRMLYGDDGKPGARAVVILGENLWRGSLGADPNIIGTEISLDKRSFTVVGIMPSAFCFPLFSAVTQPPQIWIPVLQDPLFGKWITRRSGHWLQVTGRVKPNIPFTRVQAEMNAFAANIAKEYPAENSGWLIRMIPLREMIVGNVRPALLVLLGAVGLVLLIACANIANLLLTRATSRAREIAVRTSLGAGRARIIGQLLSETTILGFIGGIFGIAVAYAGLHFLLAFIPPTVPVINPIRIDYSVLLFALVLSGIASAAFGLAPAFLVANSSLQMNLREGSARSGESRRGRYARNVLAAGQIALAMMLLVAAGLLVRSFMKLTAVNPGFNVQHVIKAEVALPRAQYSTPRQWIAFSDELLRGMNSQPGLNDSAVAIPGPIADGNVNLGFDIVGNPPLTRNASRTADYVSVSTGYFRMMGIPLLTGRLFDDRDRLSAPRVTTISQAFARMYFPNENPLGQQISCAFPPDPPVSRRIVGIVGDVRDVSLGQDPRPMMYVPFTQAPFPGAVLIVKSPLTTSAVAAAIRQEVAKLDKDLPVSDLAAMPDVLNASVAQPRFRTSLLALFAGIALAVAVTGIFGVISYSVACRTHEIGIRVALGASRSCILRLVSREAVVLISAGLLVGCASALTASGLLRHLLFGVSASDPLTVLFVAVSLAAVAGLAAYLPARRAMSVDPVIALRDE